MVASEVAAESVSSAGVYEALQVMSSIASPRGGEREVAHALCEWAKEQWTHVQWSVDELGDGAANLIGRLAPDQPDERLLYSHLDTSLTGNVQEDEPVTGRNDTPLPLLWDVDGDQVSGFGLTVARAPAAAVLNGFGAAASDYRQRSRAKALTLLLASSGTHDSVFSARDKLRRQTGVEYYLSGGNTPAEVVVAKCGPRGILSAEPGAGYLRVRLRSEFTAAIFAASANPHRGMPESLPSLIAQIVQWREEHGKRFATDLAIGAVTTGSPRKPDLLPALTDVHIYVMLGDNIELDDVASSLHQWLKHQLARTDLRSCEVQVDAMQEGRAQQTDPHAQVVRDASNAWHDEYGSSPKHIRDWKGSTDGVTFRQYGCATVRFGPTARADVTDARRDVIGIEELLSNARIYARLGAEDE